MEIAQEQQIVHCAIHTHTANIAKLNQTKANQTILVIWNGWIL